MVLWIVGVGMLDIEIEVAVVRAMAVDAVVCAGDEIDEIEDVLSPPVPVTELKAAADESLSTTLLWTSCALTRVITTSKRNNICEACERASMMSKVCDRSHKF